MNNTEQNVSKSDRPGDELADVIEQQQKELEDKGKAWGPEDAAKLARSNRAVVRSWMDSIVGRR